MTTPLITAQDKISENKRTLKVTADRISAPLMPFQSPTL